MSKFKYIVLAFMLTAGCTEQQTIDDDIQFSLDTKAPAALTVGSTYRVQMFAVNDRSYMLNNTGTYYTRSDVDYLVACELDADGVFIKEDAEKGINGVNGDVFLVLSSPGKACNQDGSFYFKPDSPSGFYVNAPEKKKIGNYGKIRFTNALYSPYSTIRFEFYKKPGVEDFIVQGNCVDVTGVQAEKETVKIYPALRQVAMAASGQVRSVSLTPDLSQTVSPSVKNYHCICKTADANVLKIASGIYAPKAEAAALLKMDIDKNLMDGDYIYMSCTILQGEGKRPLNLRLPLNDKSIEMKPRHDYVYKLLVESDYISVFLDVYDDTDNDWEGGETVTSGIGKLVETIHLGTWIGDGWQSNGDIGFEIG